MPKRPTHPDCQYNKSIRQHDIRKCGCVDAICPVCGKKFFTSEYGILCETIRVGINRTNLFRAPKCSSECVAKSEIK